MASKIPNSVRTLYRATMENNNYIAYLPECLSQGCSTSAKVRSLESLALAIASCKGSVFLGPWDGFLGYKGRDSVECMCILCVFVLVIRNALGPRLSKLR